MVKASAVALLRNDLGKAVHTIMPSTLEATAIYLLSALFFFRQVQAFNDASLLFKLFSLYENLYSPHNSDSSSDKIDTKLYN